VTGGNGADLFIYEAGSIGSGVDTIGNLSVGGGDAVNLVNLLGNYDPGQDAITDFLLYSVAAATRRSPSTRTAGAASRTW
jgi:hypothetical protein